MGVSKLTQTTTFIHGGVRIEPNTEGVPLLGTVNLATHTEEGTDKRDWPSASPQPTTATLAQDMAMLLNKANWYVSNTSLECSLVWGSLLGKGCGY